MQPDKNVFSEGLKAFKAGNFALANRIFSRFEKGPLSDKIIYYQAISCTRLGNDQKAILHFKQLIKSSKQRFFLLQSNMLLGYIYCKQNKLNLAENHLHSLLSNNAENPQIYSLLGYIYQKRKDHPQAEYYYKKSLQLDSKNANTNNSIGYNYLEWGEHVDKALAYIEKAVSEDGNNHAYLDTLGWYFYVKKKFSKAFYFVSKALRFGSSPESKKHLEEVKKYI